MTRFSYGSIYRKSKILVFTTVVSSGSIKQSKQYNIIYYKTCCICHYCRDKSRRHQYSSDVISSLQLIFYYYSLWIHGGTLKQTDSKYINNNNIIIVFVISSRWRCRNNKTPKRYLTSEHDIDESWDHYKRWSFF